MPKFLFVLARAEHRDLLALAERQGKSMSQLIREGIGLLKARYAPVESVYTTKQGRYIPEIKEGVRVNG